jgi:prolyl-tRNA editing enzyme YbaK/EbsC (Cys-tRNA(Pro) deacylase)
LEESDFFHGAHGSLRLFPEFYNKILSLFSICCIWPYWYNDGTYEESMSQPLSPSAQKIQDALRAAGFDLTVIEFTESTRTAQEAADRVHCTLGQIVKSLIFRGQATGKPILVLTSGSNRVDEKRISAYAGEAIGRADAEFVRAATGFAIGGVPPLGHPQPMETYLDEDLLQYPTVWAAAGTPKAVFELTPDSLQKMTAGRAVTVKE